MIGAIAGDLAGSKYEHSPIKTKEFELYDEGARITDDSVLTLATLKAVTESESGDPDYAAAYLELGRAHPDAGYGASFQEWLLSKVPKPYGSFGNGSAMRVSPVGWLFEDENEVLRQAELSASVTHNHPEGIKGAQAVAFAIFRLRALDGSRVQGNYYMQTEGGDLRTEIQDRFNYDLTGTMDEIRPGYSFDASCQGTVPAAMISFFEAEDFEDALRNAVSLGGDSDTLACIAGSLAEAAFGVPERTSSFVLGKLPEDLRAVLDSAGLIG